MRYLDWAYALELYRAYRSLEEHAYSKEIEILEKISFSNPKRPGVWLCLADAYDHLGNYYWQSAGPEAAEDAFSRAKGIYDEHAAEIAADPAQSYGIAAHYIRLAYFLACTHREDEAAEFIRKAVDTTRRVTEPADLVAAHGAIAYIHLRLGDAAAYQETCLSLVNVPVASADDLTKLRTIWIWCCAPDALEDMSLVVKRAEQLVANNSLGQRHVVLYVSGKAFYRAGRYKEAEERLEESIAGYPTNPVPCWDVINFQRLCLAMTKWQLGELDAARTLLAKIQPDLDKELQSPSTLWNYRVELELLRREAETLIEPKIEN